MAMPKRYIRRSPNLVESQPEAGAKLKRSSAKAETTKVAARLVTEKLLAYCGNTGATIP